MSRFLRYEACPRCRSIGRDNRGDNMGVYSDGSYHCFACGYHKSPKHFNVLGTNGKVENVNKDLLPFDFTREVPTRALTWLLQYGMPYSYWQESIGYSPREERLVFCVGRSSNGLPGSSLAFSIGRYVGDDKSKRKWYVWGNAHQHCEVVAASCSQGSESSGNNVVLVEDLISAHKIAYSGAAEAIPLFGTRVFGDVIHYLSTVDKTVYLWLDKDQEAHTKKSAMRLQMLTGNPVHIIHTEKDPKWLSSEQIKKELNNT